MQLCCLLGDTWAKVKSIFSSPDSSDQTHHHTVHTASRAEDPGFESRLRQDFSVLSHTSDLKIGTPVATLHYRVSAGTAWPSVSIL